MKTLLILFILFLSGTAHSATYWYYEDDKEAATLNCNAVFSSSGIGSANYCAGDYSTSSANCNFGDYEGGYVFHTTDGGNQFRYCYKSFELTPQEQCEEDGDYWYNNTCNDYPEPTEAEQCVLDGKYWYDNACNDSPELTEIEQCAASGGYWYNNTCNNSPELTEAEQCVASGDYWYNNTCNDLPEIVETPPEGYFNESDCVANSYYWYGGACHEFAEIIETPAEGYFNEAGCVANNFYWYDSSCHSSPNPTSDVDPFTCPDPDVIESFYESVYPEGISQVWEDQKNEFVNQPILDVLDLNLPNSGSAVDLNIDFKMGPNMDYGSSSTSVPNYVFTFIRLCMLITAAWTCRALIFGG